MSESPPPGLFVAGTDTDVGKTYVTALAARRLRSSGQRVGAYKPACSGSEEGPAGPVWQDVEVLRDAVGGTFPRERISPQCFRAPLAPPVAAAHEGRAVDPELLVAGLTWWNDRVDALLVEGVGGLHCPLWSDGVIADFVVDVGYPLLVVARAGLGTINHTLLTVEAARSRGLVVAGVLLNSPVQPSDVRAEASAAASNAREIERYGDVHVFGHLPWSPGLRAESDGPTIDWSSLVGPRPERS